MRLHGAGLRRQIRLRKACAVAAELWRGEEYVRVVSGGVVGAYLFFDFTCLGGCGDRAIYRITFL